MHVLPDTPIARCGQWDVYEDRIVCERAGYDLTRRELARTDIDWTAHLAAKRWCDLAAFERARAALLRAEEVTG